MMLDHELLQRAITDAIDYREDLGDHCGDCDSAGGLCDDHEDDMMLAQCYRELGELLAHEWTPLGDKLAAMGLVDTGWPAPDPATRIPPPLEGIDFIPLGWGVGPLLPGGLPREWFATA